MLFLPGINIIRTMTSATWYKGMDKQRTPKLVSVIGCFDRISLSDMGIVTVSVRYSYMSELYFICAVFIVIRYLFRYYFPC